MVRTTLTDLRAKLALPILHQRRHIAHELTVAFQTAFELVAAQRNRFEIAGIMHQLRIQHMLDKAFLRQARDLFADVFILRGMCLDPRPFFLRVLPLAQHIHHHARDLLHDQAQTGFRLLNHLIKTRRIAWLVLRIIQLTGAAQTHRQNIRLDLLQRATGQANEQHPKLRRVGNIALQMFQILLERNPRQAQQPARMYRTRL